MFQILVRHQAHQALAVHDGNVMNAGAGENQGCVQHRFILAQSGEISCHDVTHEHEDILGRKRTTVPPSARLGRGALPLGPPVLREVDLPKTRWLQDFKSDFEGKFSRPGRSPHHPAASEALRIPLSNIKCGAHGKLLTAADHPAVHADDKCFHGFPFFGVRRTRRANIQRHPHDDTEAASPELPPCGNPFLQWHQNDLLTGFYAAIISHGYAHASLPDHRVDCGVAPKYWPCFKGDCWFHLLLLSAVVRMTKQKRPLLSEARKPSAARVNRKEIPTGRTFRSILRILMDLWCLERKDGESSLKPPCGLVLELWSPGAKQHVK